VFWEQTMVIFSLWLSIKYEIWYLCTKAQKLLFIAFPSEFDYFDIDNHRKHIVHYLALYFNMIALVRDTDRLCILLVVYFFYLLFMWGLWSFRRHKKGKWYSFNFLYLRVASDLMRLAFACQKIVSKDPL
jgi:hypothetical protein